MEIPREQVRDSNNSKMVRKDRNNEAELSTSMYIGTIFFRNQLFLPPPPANLIFSPENLYEVDGEINHLKKEFMLGYACL